MLDKILAPLDGSSLAECVLPHALSLGQAGQMEVILLHVVEQESSTAESQSIDPLDWHLRKAEAQAYLESVSAHLKDAGLSVEQVLLEGQAAERVVEFARQRQVDLILLSSHGRGGLSGWNVSSVVQKIILRAYTSIMLVRAYQSEPDILADLRYRRFLVPLDGSKRAECVLPLVTHLAQTHQAQLILVHVVARPEMPRRAPLTPEDTELAQKVVERNYQEAEKYLEQLKSHLPAQTETRLLVSDTVITTLHDLVEEESADLVVLSAHGYSCDKDRPYGSVGASFIAHGTTPLLIFQDLKEEEIEPTQAEVVIQQIGNSHGGRPVIYDKPSI